jgi:tyrosyl-tRNA synthetase
MRQILDYEKLDENAASITKQLDAFLGFDGQNAFTANNKDWLAELNYIDFLRDIGSHFSVNRMLSFEAYRLRMETGLSFLEFNYQLLQSYDFLQLFRKHGCRLQIGGDDQWGNIVAGSDLIRRIDGAEVFGLTFPLITTADGKKMGKTEKGALFLDPTITSPYDFFQYWRNVQDVDVRRFLLMFTFLSVGECTALTVEGANPNIAKERLAWEVTALIHGKGAADRALAGARASFGGLGGDKSAAPSVSLPMERFAVGYNIVELFTDAGLCSTKSEARRLVQQGGAFVSHDDGEFVSITEPKAIVGFSKELVLRAGKKRTLRVF